MSIEKEVLRYAHYDPETFKLLGYYASDIHGDNIPTPHVLLSEQDWLDALAINANHVNVDARKLYVVTPDITLEDATSTVKSYLDRKAAELGYDNIASAVSYAEEPAVPKYQEEGRRFRTWRSLVWQKFYELSEEWGQAGPVPSNFKDLLPSFESIPP